MNRRDLFKGLAAALAAASVPITVEQLVSLPESEVVLFLRRVRRDIVYQIANPALIMEEDGTIHVLPKDVQKEALRHVDILLKELTA